MKDVRRIAEYDIIRVILTLLVVLGHSLYITIATKYGGIDYLTLMNESGISAPIMYKLLSLGVEFIYSFHMQAYIALSGVVFAIQMRKLNPDILKKKAKRLLVPYVMVGLLYSVPLKLIAGYYNNSENVAYDVLVGQMFCQGNNYLWFCVTLFLICVFIYLLETKVKGHEYIKLMVMLVLCLMPSFCKINIVNNVLRYLFWFYIGYCFQKFEWHNKIKFSSNKIKDCAVSVLLTFALFAVKFLLPKFSEIDDLKILSCMLSLLGCISLYKICLSVVDCRFTKSSIYQKILNNSYEIYLYSDPLNYVILALIYFMCGIDVFASNLFYLLMFVVRFVVTIIIAIGISKLLKESKKIISKGSLSKD